jgi:hypothetical protein
MPPATGVESALPPQAEMFQMMTGAWVTKVISEATRLAARGNSQEFLIKQETL